MNIYIYIYIYHEKVDIFGRSDMMMKNKWNSDYTKTQATNFSFLFIKRTFQHFFYFFIKNCFKR